MSTERMAQSGLQAMRLLVVGLNHRTAPVDLREAVASSPAHAAAATEAFRAKYPHAELVILSTCNRVELYMARPESRQPTLESVVEFLADFHGIQGERLCGHLYHHEDRGMIEHLFAVASSLDSMVVGETQILSQVKHAYLHGCDPTKGMAGTGVGKVLHGLFQRALAAAKEVHEKTELATGHLSVASVAVDLAASVFKGFDDKLVLCVGAGNMGLLMLRHLADLKPRRVVIVNRTIERAEGLAAEFAEGGGKAEARPFEELNELLGEADILLTCTGAGVPVITEERFKPVHKRRGKRAMVMVDIGVPRDIEPGVAKLKNVYLYNIDDLQEMAARNQGKRDREMAAAREMLKGHVEGFLKWFSARDMGPLVKALYEQAEGLARAELETHFARHPDMAEEERTEVARLARRLVAKLLHGPVTQLTTHAETTARPMLAEAVRRLFEIPAEEATEAGPRNGDGVEMRKKRAKGGTDGGHH
jgi:glutamyl-tRNA reductase